MVIIIVKNKKSNEVCRERERASQTFGEKKLVQSKKQQYTLRLKELCHYNEDRPRLIKYTGEKDHYDKSTERDGLYHTAIEWQSDQFGSSQFGAPRLLCVLRH